MSCNASPPFGPIYPPPRKTLPPTASLPTAPAPSHRFSWLATSRDRRTTATAPAVDFCIRRCKGNFLQAPSQPVPRSGTAVPRTRNSCCTPHPARYAHGKYILALRRASRRAINVSGLAHAVELHGKNDSTFFVEPIQGEAGIVVPDAGYLAQTGFCRNARCERDGVQPNTSSARRSPCTISAVLADRDVMLFASSAASMEAPMEPARLCRGNHGAASSSMRGSPSAMQVCVRSRRCSLPPCAGVLVDEGLAARSGTGRGLLCRCAHTLWLGEVFRAGVRTLALPLVAAVCVRGRIRR
ncbi:hypothetical protein GGX14DRAFT_574632 [Mycena pura]|uniref:Uncharacterized protein n=1 Tax=Mycena pura TaxID=153505 RepID=A0AAD6UZ22_9AGAR|nr:hypothetical protein GGX14DRAFT_574632 [Mycena pura]